MNCFMKCFRIKLELEPEPEPVVTEVVPLVLDHDTIEMTPIECEKTEN